MAQLEIVGLRHEFRREGRVTLAIDGIDLSVEAGEFLTWLDRPDAARAHCFI